MGADLDRSFAELLGRTGGLCGGRGGSMHLTDVSIGALGSNAIVGAHLPISVGAALSAKLRKTESVSAAADRARAGEGPTLIEANTYRQVGQSRSDPATYRPEGELDWWLARGPIPLLESAMHAPRRQPINESRRSTQPRL